MTDVQSELAEAAGSLVKKLGECMTWRDRELGFDEWKRLQDALKAVKKETLIAETRT